MASTSEEQHEVHLKQLFTRLTKYGVRINPPKCVLGQKEVQFLGYLVTTEGTRPLPTKIEAIRNFPKPTNAKQLRQFLGTINFYRRFIPGTAKDQAALNGALRGSKTKEKTPIHWTTEMDAAFEKSKEGFGASDTSGAS